MCGRGHGPSLFGLAPGGLSLLRFPWGHPRRELPGTLSPWSPDFPRCRLFKPDTAAAQPPDRGCMWLSCERRSSGGGCGPGSKPLKPHREAVTSSVAFGATSSIKEEEGDNRGRSDQTPSSSLMEEVAAKRSELVRVTGSAVAAGTENKRSQPRPVFNPLTPKPPHTIPPAHPPSALLDYSPVSPTPAPARPSPGSSRNSARGRCRNPTVSALRAP